MGNLLSKLKIGVLIGAGHFGQVFEGDDPVHGRVAVKQITRRPTDSDDRWDARKEGAQEEAQHLKKASHRNVVQVHHYCEDDADELILYVMEFCEGGSLQSPCESGPLAIDEVRPIATDLFAGLAALHSHGMLHRDIKPGNLLRNARGVTKLGDFGLVTDRLVHGYGSDGDYAYHDHIAPEVWAGGPTSAKTDIWASGMTLFRLLHGQSWHDEYLPPNGAITGGRFADKLCWLPHIPADWRRTIRLMLRDDPADRYKTAVDVERTIASLSVDPAWNCTVSTSKIEWVRTKRDRRISVIWDRTDRKKTTWRAWSEPISGSGRRRSLGESTTFLKEKIAHKQIQGFFSTQN